MKILLRIILFLVIGLLCTGFYFQITSEKNAEFYIGIGVLLLAFVLIPLFIYHGYKGKDLTRYSFKNMQKPEDKKN
jgi:peptidoglycan/LPS O-acetylase OafA/YrhL